MQGGDTGGILAKSAVYQTSVEASISPLTEQEAEQAGMDWIDALVDAAQEATDAANAAAQSQGNNLVPMSNEDIDEILSQQSYLVFGE